MVYQKSHADLTFCSPSNSTPPENLRLEPRFEGLVQMIFLYNLRQKLRFLSPSIFRGIYIPAIFSENPKEVTWHVKVWPNFRILDAHDPSWSFQAWFTWKSADPEIRRCFPFPELGCTIQAFSGFHPCYNFKREKLNQNITNFKMFKPYISDPKGGFVLAEYYIPIRNWTVSMSSLILTTSQ